MNKTPKLIAVLVVIFIFGIQLLVFESYQSLFPTSDKNDNNYLFISSIKENNNNNDDDDEESESVICTKLLDSETCKKIEKEIESKTKKLSKEELQAEEITSKYLEPVEPNQDKNQASQPTPTSPSTTTSSPSASVTPPPLSPPPSSSSTPALSLSNLNTLDQSQLIDAISSKISQLRTFEKTKITQALSMLAATTAAKGGNPIDSLRQIGTTILEDPSASIIDRIIGLAQTK